MRAEVRCRVPGRDVGMPPVLVELAAERTTVRDLIRLAVQEQIAELRADASRCRHLLDRQYLTDAEVAAGAARGAVKMPSGEAGVARELDVAQEVERAVRAFGSRTFAVFIGGRQAEHLDDEVTVRLGEPVLFLRLTALAGG